MKVAFDIGGVLSKYPAQFKELISRVSDRGRLNDVFVISDMFPREKIIDLLKLNEVPFIEGNVWSADYERFGDGCKAELLNLLKIDLFFDDHIGYVATSVPGYYPTIRCLVWPDASKPYRADDWIVPDGEPEFGRITYHKAKAP